MRFGALHSGEILEVLVSHQFHHLVQSDNKNSEPSVARDLFVETAHNRGANWMQQSLPHDDWHVDDEKQNHQ